MFGVIGLDDVEGGSDAEPLTLPYALHPLVVRDPAIGPQHGRDTTMAVAAILAGQADNRRSQSFLVIGDNTIASLRRSRLSQIPARPAFRETELLLNMGNTTPAALGAYQFPSAASFRTNFSKVRSATARRRQPFSRSSSFRRRA